MVMILLTVGSELSAEDVGGTPVPPVHEPGSEPVAAAPAAVKAVASPAWASAVGADRFGSWADLSVRGVTQRMRWIAPGSFTMGSSEAEQLATIKEGATEDWVLDEKSHAVTLTAGFWLADCACTQALWKKLSSANPSAFVGTGSLPVEMVSFDDIQQFLADLNAVTKGSFRLPSEAEREYACRAGTNTAFAGPSLDDLGWHKGNSMKRTHMVKTKEPNAWGLYDMHGNVYDWCADWYAPYPDGPATDPAGPAEGIAHIVRGGCWYDFPGYNRSAFRWACSPDQRDHGLGFRLCASSPLP